MAETVLPVVAAKIDLSSECLRLLSNKERMRSALLLIPAELRMVVMEQIEETITQLKPYTKNEIDKESSKGERIQNILARMQEAGLSVSDFLESNQV